MIIHNHIKTHHKEVIKKHNLKRQMNDLKKPGGLWGEYETEFENGNMKEKDIPL